MGKEQGFGATYKATISVPVTITAPSADLARAVAETMAGAVPIEAAGTWDMLGDWSIAYRPDEQSAVLHTGPRKRAQAA